MQIKKKKIIGKAAIFLIAVSLSLSGCSNSKNTAKENGTTENKSNSNVQSDEKKEKGKIRIGSSDTPEVRLYTELYASALEKEGYQVEKILKITGENLHTSLINDEIDIYPEYTGTALTSILKEEPVIDPTSLYEKVAAKYKEQFEFLLLEPVPANYTLGVAVTKKVAADLDLVYISDLQKNAAKINFAASDAFLKDPNGLAALNKAYGQFAFKAQKTIDDKSGFETLKKGEADATVAYLTDGALAGDEYVVLKDDGYFWKPNNIVPVIKPQLLDKYSDVKGIVNNISVRLNQKAVRVLNAELEASQKQYSKVARKYLEEIK